MESVQLHFAANGKDIKLLEVKFKDELAFLMKVAASLSWWTSTLCHNFHTVTAYGPGLLARCKAECQGFILLHKTLARAQAIKRQEQSDCCMLFATTVSVLYRWLLTPQGATLRP